ncbi:hypothetical protein ACJIZ3_020626 [Penstemon smallii]|uniref:F-box domain-containing protein n=1 Tax=Penstemon smallii TaxID=265156 RepID=A0ABD3SJ57_9LAMI
MFNTLFGEMSDIPPDLHPKILSRVFAVSLLRFRCVCKEWLRIIDDPNFTKWHLRLQTEEGQGQLIFCNRPGNKLYTLSLDSLNYSHTPIRMVVALSLKILPRGGASHIPTLPVPACNGLILISRHVGDVWAVWNPFTREAHVLPSYTTFSLAEGGNPFCYGFGYDSVADDYKVVKITKYYDQTDSVFKFETLVYSVKSNSWGRVKDCPYFPLFGVPGVFVNGALHWICLLYRGEDELLILALELATLDYHLLSPPSMVSKPGWCLNASAGYLLLTCYNSVYRLDDYGGENSWTKLLSFSGMGLGEVRPIAYLKSREEVLLQRYADEYFWFDIKKKSPTRVSISGDVSSSQICMGSLVRLNNSGGIDGSNSAKETALWKRNMSIDR